MDKEAALLVASKDLFIEGLKHVPDLFKFPSDVIKDQKQLDYLADQFIAFHKKLSSALAN